MSISLVIRNITDRALNYVIDLMTWWLNQLNFIHPIHTVQSEWHQKFI